MSMQIIVENLLKKINETINFGILKESVDNIIDDCKKLDIYNSNQYFYDIVSNLEHKIKTTMYSLHDIYILEDIHHIKNFLNYKYK